MSLALCLAPGPVALATAQKAGKPARRIVQSVPPEYPATLLAVRVGGLVRLNVTVSVSGNVTKIELLGGNPILSDSAIKAVTKWKYAPAAAETTHEVQIRFNPDSPKIP